MAPQKIFILGATGYIGGDALCAIHSAHPDWEYTCLVRNSDKGGLVAAQYPKVRLVYGDLDSVDLIEKEAAGADVVLTFADCDHVASAEAVVKGIQSKTTPSWLIHTSGTGILTYETTDKKAFGKALPKVYDDFDGITELTSLPDHAPHRPVDKIILSASTPNPSLIHTAIVCPPEIYGLGRGPSNIDSIQVPFLARSILQNGEAFSINGSENQWSSIHIHDLSNLYLLLTNCTSSENPTGSPATWNQQGYYLASSPKPFAWITIISALVNHASSKKLNLIDSPAIPSLTAEQAEAISPGIVGVIGSNSIGSAIRARKLLGWDDVKSQEVGGPEQTVEEVLEREGKKLGLIKGHGEVVGEKAGV